MPLQLLAYPEPFLILAQKPVGMLFQTEDPPSVFTLIDTPYTIGAHDGILLAVTSQVQRPAYAPDSPFRNACSLCYLPVTMCREQPFHSLPCSIVHPACSSLLKPQFLGLPPYGANADAKLVCKYTI